MLLVMAQFGFDIRHLGVELVRLVLFCLIQ